MKDAGFTLIEVLAALMVFSVAIVGLTRAGTESSRAAAALETRMIAGIVADNQLSLARNEAIIPGNRSGTTEQLSREFSYNIEAEGTEVAGLLRLTIQVREAGEDQIVAERIAFLSAR